MPKLLLIKKSKEVLYEIYTTSFKDCPASWSGHFYTDWERKEPQRQRQRKRHSKLKWIPVVSNINAVIQIIP